MGKFFSPFSPFFQGMRKIYQFIGLNFLWIICSLPIITIGAATTALYYTVTKVIRQSRGYMFKEFFNSFIKNFKQATIIWLIYIAIGFSLTFSIRVIYITDKASMKILLIPMIMLCIILIVNVTYYLILLARFNNTCVGLLKSAFILSILHFPTTLLVIVIITVSAILTYIWQPLKWIIMPAVAMLLSICMEKVFVKYMPEGDKDEQGILN